MKVCFLFVILFFFISNADAETIKVRASQSKFDSTHDYYIGLIKLAYKKINKPIKVEYAPYMVQERALSEMQAGRLIDLYWAGSNVERESKLGFVPIPLVKGLLGYRVFTINKKYQSEFLEVNSLEDLNGIPLCQGQHWPDTDILLASGLNVVPNMVYENMFRQVYSGRCKAFPRGINEGYSEVESRQKVMPELMVFDDLILHYPFPMYFFTHKENKKLINNLTDGLMLAIEDGSFNDYMAMHPATRHLFPLSKWSSKTIITIENPFLSNNADFKNPKLWVDLKIKN